LSGICGIYHPGGERVDPHDLDAIASMLVHRGPERTGTWHGGSVAFGHTLLATTPEARLEKLPHVHAASGCAITGDVRIDNRDELLARLRLDDRGTIIGEVQLVLAAYLEWGEACVERLLGDFAFAIWDQRARRLFCARDPMGMRPLYYTHTAAWFMFASEPRAILVVPHVPFEINELRIADYLGGELEGSDSTTSF
jgi:asparagine synthase (glutamine-hydrolysing)